VIDSDGVVRITGNRYQFSGQKMPKFKEWDENEAKLDTSRHVDVQSEIPIDPPIRNENFIRDITGKVDFATDSKITRLDHSHGHSLQEIYALRQGKLERTVDLVVYIIDHGQAEYLIKKAMEHDVVLIPYGGGTNVTEALMCDKKETRMIVSVDMTRMNRLKWVDKNNMMACVEAGIIGKDLEKELSKFDVMCGHEPDSVEFSSLGGWVSTRASGMKKNKYGNIDDIVVGIKIATPIGTFNRHQNVPRISSGPDIHEFILGHEGNFGIITECVIKLRPLPEVRIYESIIFHDF
jgi:alkyldihydroxyacetonephosphate synthase